VTAAPGMSVRPTKETGFVAQETRLLDRGLTAL
jgi:hypothetical protein